MNIELFTISEEPIDQMAPPWQAVTALLAAWLFLRVALVIVNVPPLEIPPPSWAEFPEKVQLRIAAWLRVDRAPPTMAAELAEKVSPLSVSVVLKSVKI